MVTESRVLKHLSEQLATVTGSYCDTLGLPPEAYTSEHIFALERKEIFLKEWLCVGRAEQLPEVGDYFTVTLLGEPLIVVRHSDRSVRVMSAVCRHRGMVITSPGDGRTDDWLRPPPDSKGNATHGFRCPYHFWTYGTDGSLRGAPHMSRTGRFDKYDPDLCLPNLRTETWQGFVFVNFSATAPRLEERLNALDDMVAHWNLGDMVTEEPSRLDAVPWNWKIMHENSIDVYHVDRLHFPRHSVLPSKGYLDVNIDTGDAAIVLAQLATHKDFALSPIGQPLFPVIDGLTDEERGRAYVVLIPPTLLVILNSDSAFYRLVYPLGAGAIDIRQTLMVPDRYRTLPNYTDLVSIGADMHLKLNYQDYVVDSEVQRAAASIFAPRGPFAWNEQSVAEFDSWVARRYAAALSAIASEDGPTQADVKATCIAEPLRRPQPADRA